jgi:hypothetical protein
MTATAIFLALGYCDSVRASWPCGIYARIDKVEVGPDKNKPTWVKVYGDFIMVKTSGRLCGPQRGYMYFHAVEGKGAHCALEWADLQSIAGKDGNFVAFGSADAEQNDDLGRDGDDAPNVHQKDDATIKSVAYPLNHGLTRLRMRDPGEPVKRLQKYLNEHPLKKE